MEDRIVIDLLNTRATFNQVRGFILNLNLMSKHLEVRTNDPAVAGLAVCLMANMNKVTIINGTVIKSFHDLYVVGEEVGWLADYKTINF